MTSSKESPGVEGADLPSVVRVGAEMVLGRRVRCSPKYVRVGESGTGVGVGAEMVLGRGGCISSRTIALCEFGAERMAVEGDGVGGGAGSYPAGASFPRVLVS